MMTKIESGIPVSEPRRTALFTPLFRKMKVGDSVLLRLKGHQRTALYKQARRLGIRVVVRKQPNGCYRIWRIRRK